MVTLGSGLAIDFYVFCFPKGEVMLDGEDSPKIECIFRVDSNTGLSETLAEGLHAAAGHGVINIVNPEGAEIGIYSLEGWQVCRLTDRQAVVSVAPGCYIVSGAGRSFKLTVE